MSRTTPMYDGRGHRAPGLLQVLWNRLRGRHDDGTRHRWIKNEDQGGQHWCDGDYCHHYRVRCTVCGAWAICGDAVQEVR
jgi:hypothetical protein